MVGAVLGYAVCGYAQDAGWSAYNGGLNGDHYSPLAQINRSNVSQLQMAWRYDTGSAGDIQTNPLIVGQILYGSSPSGQILALSADTGKRLWTFDPAGGKTDADLGSTQPIRGFSYWSDGHEARLFVGVMNFLYALDPATGHPVLSFGEDGRVDLRKGLRDSEGYEKPSVISQSATREK